MASPHGGPPPHQNPPTVAAVLRQFLPEFLARTPVSPHLAQVLRRLSRCGTGQLGWALWECELCAQTHWRPLGCGDRHCTQCQARPRQTWLDQQRQALLPVRYYHWVFTLPALLRPLALQNPKALYTLLFDAAAATLLQFGHERFGARLGLTALLPTWGQNLIDHPHLHCLVTGGGLLSTPGQPPQWRGPKQARYLFPVHAVAKLFAGKFLARLQALRTQGQLQFHGRLEAWRDPAAWERALGTLRATKWVVFAKGSVAGPESVLDYLGRYTHRVAITNARLVHWDTREVTFRYKDYRQGAMTRQMSLDGVEFLRRFSLHILPPGFTKIRHYGILGNNQRAKLVPLARTALARSPWHLETAPATATLRPTPEPPRCSNCGSDALICVGRLDADGDFTGLRRGAIRVRLRAGEPPALLDSS